jgi:TetR/AcrR family transcriptional regulator
MSPLSSATRRPGRPRSSEVDSREKLLAAALTAFADFGFEGASLRAIAVAAGFDVAMIFHRFGSKEGLWRAVVESVAADFQASLAHELLPLIQGDAPLVQRVTQVLDIFMDKLVQRPTITLLIMRETSVPGERRDFLVSRLLGPSCERFAPFWQEAMEAGVLRRSDPVLFHVGIFGAMAMILAFRPILPNLGAAEMDLAELKAHIHRGLLADAV